jgi:uracil-DNA glycosylase
MPRIRLTLLVGGYAQTYVLGRGTPGKTMTEHVRGFQQTLPRYFPLPHPSWRTTAWERRNPWFAATVLPALRHVVAAALA